jgi:hypothetical protein
MICSIPSLFLKETVNKKLKEEIDELTRKFSIKKDNN